jgi:hypothetical protein
LNDAIPIIGGISPVNFSPVLSYTTTNQLNGNPRLGGHDFAVATVLPTSSPSSTTARARGAITRNISPSSTPLRCCISISVK